MMVSVVHLGYDYSGVTAVCRPKCDVCVILVQRYTNGLTDLIT